MCLAAKHLILWVFVSLFSFCPCIALTLLGCAPLLQVVHSHYYLVCRQVTLIVLPPSFKMSSDWQTVQENGFPFDLHWLCPKSDNFFRITDELYEEEQNWIWGHILFENVVVCCYSYKNVKEPTKHKFWLREKTSCFQVLGVYCCLCEKGMQSATSWNW